MEMGGIEVEMELLLSPLQLGYQKMQITSLTICLSTCNIFPVRFFPLLLCISSENRTNLITFEPQTIVEHKFANIQNTFDKGPFRMESKQKQTWGGGDPHPYFHSKSNK